MSSPTTTEEQKNNNTPITIDVVSDVACPWCYVGKRRLALALSQFKQENSKQQQEQQVDIQVKYLPYLLNPQMPSEGIDRQKYFMSRFGVSDLATSPMAQRLKQVGQQIGIDFHLDKPDVVSSTLNAHRLLMKAAEISPEAQGSIKEELFKHYFELGQDIGDVNVLEQIVKKCGLEAQIDKQFIVSEHDGYRNQVLNGDQRAKRELGVEGVPFFIFNNKYTVSGAQDVPTLLAMMKKLIK